MIPDVHFPPFPRRQIIRIGLMVAGVWALLAAVGWIFQAHKFYEAYLLAWLFWLGVSLGAMGVVMLHHLMGGHWGYMVRRLGEHAAMMLPLMFLLFFPIAIGMHSLYPWDRADELAKNAILRHEQPYLNPQFFMWRVVIYAVSWCSLAWYLRSASLRYDRTANANIALRLHNISAGGMLFYFVSMSFASVDWIMSREPGWFSTVFGFIIVAGQAISGLCVLLVCFLLMLNTPPFREEAEENHLNDLGNLLLTIVIVWAYMSFVQLLVIWMGNKQDEIPWYVHRLSAGWWWIGLILVCLHFGVPFIVLLMRQLKRKVPVMLGLCAGLLVLRVIDLFWQTGPSGDEPYIKLWHVWNWMDVIFPIGMGGLWIAGFLWLTEGHSLIPLKGPVPVANAAAES